MATLTALFRLAWSVVRSLWYTGNYWIRVALGLAVVVPIWVTVAAQYGQREWVAGSGLLLLFAVFLIFMLWIDPLIFPLLNKIGDVDVVTIDRQGRRVNYTVVQKQWGSWLLRMFRLVLGFELLYVLYCFFVPIWNNPVLIVPFLLVGVAFFVLLPFFLKKGEVAGPERFLPRHLRTALVVVMAAITVAFFFPRTTGRIYGASATVDSRLDGLLTKVSAFSLWEMSGYLLGLAVVLLIGWALWKGKREFAIVTAVVGILATLWLTGTFARWAAAIPPVEASPRIVQRYEPEGLRSAYTCTPREFTVDLNGPDVPSREVTIGFPGSDVPPGCRFTFCYPEGTELQWEDRPRVKLTMDHTNSPGMPGRTVFYGPKGGMVVFKVHP